jgi:MoxR-like ATPase
VTASPEARSLPGDDSAVPSIARTAEMAARILAEVEKAVVGKREVLELVLAGLLADGHVLLDDVPGVAKTLMARSLATAAGLDFSRVQFTPDMLPADITGATVLELLGNQTGVSQGSDLLAARPCRRGQSRSGQDPGRAA